MQYFEKASARARYINVLLHTSLSLLLQSLLHYIWQWFCKKQQEKIISDTYSMSSNHPRKEHTAMRAILGKWKWELLPALKIQNVPTV